MHTNSILDFEGGRTFSSYGNILNHVADFHNIALVEKINQQLQQRYRMFHILRSSVRTDIALSRLFGKAQKSM